MQPVNLSKKNTISFLAKGDGNPYTILVLTEARSGQNGEAPAMATFTAGPEWKQYTFPFSAFETDGGDLIGVGFIRDRDPGKFQFQIDELEIKYRRVPQLRRSRGSTTSALLLGVTMGVRCCEGQALPR
jgi:hypothetical protein